MNLSLPPHLDQFVREQLASGNFQTESDVIQAALRLLKEQSHRPLPAPPKPVSKESRFEPREPSQGGPLPGSGATRFGSGRRSPRGLLADIPSRITHDDIKEARREMWSTFPSGEAR